MQSQLQTRLSRPQPILTIISLDYAITHHLTPFVSMQNHYSLLYREEEREMNKFCKVTGVGLIPWSPLARESLR